MREKGRGRESDREGEKEKGCMGMIGKMILIMFFKEDYNIKAHKHAGHRKRNVLNKQF